VVDTTLVNPVVGDGGAFLLEARPELKPTVARFLSSTSAGASAPASLSIEVLNGAGVPGLAARTADRLAQAGFTVARVGDAPRTQAQTTVLAKPSARATAERLAAAAGLPASRISESTAAMDADIQITLGTDAQAL